jgi:hypothetical protein
VRRPVTEEWTRFESYARRIKVLSCSLNSIEDKMLEALADHFQESAVLPNLRHLSCCKDAKVNKYMGLFLAPRLTHLHFSPSTRSSRTQLLQSLLTPHAQTFEIWRSGPINLSQVVLIVCSPQCLHSSGVFRHLNLFIENFPYPLQQSSTFHAFLHLRR